MEGGEGGATGARTLDFKSCEIECGQSAVSILQHSDTNSVFLLFEPQVAN